MAVTRVGLISDTHGWLDPRAVQALRDAEVDLLIHAGDIGAGPDVLLELRGLSPRVVAVQGNCDRAIPGFELRDRARVTVTGSELLIVHDISSLGGEIPEEVDIVVRGHTHRADEVWHGRVRVLNPGSASQQRSMPSCSVALLDFPAEGEPVFTVVWLDEIELREP